MDKMAQRSGPPAHFLRSLQSRMKRAGAEESGSESLLSPNEKRAGAVDDPEALVPEPGTQSQTQTQYPPERASRHPGWIGFIAVVTACALAGTIMGGIALGHNAEIRDHLIYFWSLIDVSFNFTVAGSYASTSFCTESFFVAAYDDEPEAGSGTLFPTGIVNIRRIGNFVHVNTYLRPSNTTLSAMSEIQPYWVNPSIYLIFDYFLVYDCIPPILNWDPCHAQAGGVCNDVNTVNVDPTSDYLYYESGDVLLPVSFGTPSIFGAYPVAVSTCTVMNGINGTGGAYMIGAECSADHTEFLSEDPGTQEYITQIVQDIYYQTDAPITWTPPDSCVTTCTSIPS